MNMLIINLFKHDVDVAQDADQLRNPISGIINHLGSGEISIRNPKHDVHVHNMFVNMSNMFNMFINMLQHVSTCCNMLQQENLNMLHLGLWFSPCSRVLANRVTGHFERSNSIKPVDLTDRGVMEKTEAGWNVLHDDQVGR